MTKKITQAQQDEAYNHGYRSFDQAKPFANPYDSDKYWLLFMAYEQGWNDRRDWEFEQLPQNRQFRA